MKLPFTAALALTLLTTGVFANDSDNPAGTALVPNNHGGYNVTQPAAMPVSTALIPNNHGGYNVTEPGARPVSIPFFGSNGYAAIVITHSHDKPKFILVPVIEDVGHGVKITVYKRVYFATAEQAEAAKGTYH